MGRLLETVRVIVRRQIDYSLIMRYCRYRLNVVSRRSGKVELSSSLVYGGQKEGWRILLIDHARSQPA